MIKYLGSKRVLVPLLVDLVRKLPGDVRTCVDLFSGTCRVGHAMKRAGYQVTANDHNAYAHALAGCYVQADADAVLAPAERLLAELQSLPPRPGRCFLHAGKLPWTVGRASTCRIARRQRRGASRSAPTGSLEEYAGWKPAVRGRAWRGPAAPTPKPGPSAVGKECMARVAQK